MREHKPEGPAPAAVKTRAGKIVVTGTNVATVPACAPGAHRKIWSQEAQGLAATKLQRNRKNSIFNKLWNTLLCAADKTVTLPLGLWR